MMKAQSSEWSRVSDSQTDAHLMMKVRNSLDSSVCLSVCLSDHLSVCAGVCGAADETLASEARL